MQAADHWQMTCLRKGMAGLQHALHIKQVGRQILANFISRRLHEAWNAWLDIVEV